MLLSPPAVAECTIATIHTVATVMQPLTLLEVGHDIPIEPLMSINQIKIPSSVPPSAKASYNSTAKNPPQKTRPPLQTMEQPLRDGLSKCAPHVQ